MSRYYIWKGKAPIVEVDVLYPYRYRHAFVYDRHGIQGYDWNVVFKGKLTKRAKRHMPKEFLMHLVLLGVNL